MTLLDGLKGVTAVWLGRRLGAGTVALLLVGPAVIAGYAFPLLAHVQGEKGLAATFGVFLGWTFWPTVLALGLCGSAGAPGQPGRAVVVGAAAIALPPFPGYPWAMSLYARGLAHEQRVWAASGRQGAFLLARGGQVGQNGTPDLLS